MFDLFRKWFTPGEALNSEDLEATVRLTVRLALVLFLSVLMIGAVVVLGTNRPTAVEDQAPDAMVRMLIAVGVWGVTCLCAYATIQAWDNSHRATLLLHVQPHETDLVLAAKILAAVLIDVAIILAAALVFGRVVGL